MKKPHSPLHLWWHDDDSSDDDDENRTPRASKAKESPLPSLSSANTPWEAATNTSPLNWKGLHHRANAATAATAERCTSAFTAFSSSDAHVSLPRTVHSPYRERRRRPIHNPKYRISRGLFTGLIALVIACWTVTGILYACLPRHVPSSWWSRRSVQPWQNLAVASSPLRNLKRQYISQSSTTRRQRDSRRRRPETKQIINAVSPIRWNLDGERREDAKEVHTSPASMEALCGYAAEMASLRHPDYFPDSLALDEKSRILWVGPRWDLLRQVLDTCPDTQLLQVVRTLPDDPLERIRILREHSSLIFNPHSSDPIRFVETLPLGLQTRQTTQAVTSTDATHVVWVLDEDGDDNDEQAVELLTLVVQTRQMIQDLRDVPHLVIVGVPATWRTDLVRAANLTSVTWVSDTASLVPAMQMRHGFLHMDDLERKALLPSTDTEPLPSAVVSRLPCASECADPEHCQASEWDDAVSITRPLTEECTIVVYTATGDARVQDLAATEFQEDDNAKGFICNVAFVPRTSSLVQSVIRRVPNPDLVRLGVKPLPGDDAHAIHQRKLDTLNGKLLYRGWVLVWINTNRVALPVLNPGMFWSETVRFALYCDPTVAPSQTDTNFLVHQMHRSAWPARRAKHGSEHYLLPAEPARRAVLLLAERRFKKKVVTLKKAIKMWGDDEMANVTMLHRQAAFYDQLDIIFNRARQQRRYYKPQDPLIYTYRIGHWATTRWILHDLQNEEASRFRCSWYEEVEHTQGSPALALAHLLALQDMERRAAFGEPDDHTIQHTWARRMAFKQKLTDVLEWFPLAVETNRPFASTTYQLDTTLTLMSQSSQSIDGDLGTPLYVRIMSDRVLAASRKAYQGR